MNIPICNIIDNQLVTCGTVTYCNDRISGSNDIFEILSLLHLNIESSEMIFTVLVNDLLVPTMVVNVGVGNQVTASLDFNKLFRTLLLSNCNNYYLAHNHPSQNRIPSKQDIDLTKLLLDLSSIMGFNLVDHLIIVKDDFYEICRNCNLI